MSYGLMRWRLICLVPIASSMCGGDQVRTTKISVSCLQSSMVVGMSRSGAAWVLQALESYISLREIWTPCTMKLCSRTWSPPPETGLQGSVSAWQWSQTHLQDDYCFTEEAEGKGDGLAKHVSRLEPNRTSWGGVFKRKVEVCKVSNICQLRDVVMEEWMSISVATCEALVNSIPRRVKAVLGNDGGHTKYWQLT